jgi:sugar/nucleoside kinase (ribokinase family)
VPKLHNIVRGLVDTVQRKSGKISFDPNIRPELIHDPNVSKSISELISLCDCFMPSESDLSYLYPAQDPNAVIRQLVKTSSKVVAYKKGAAGATIFADGEEYNLDGHQIHEVDPTGAGDCFCGTFTTLYYDGYSAELAGKYANAAGALAASKLGPMEGNSTLGEIQHLLDSDKVQTRECI